MEVKIMGVSKSYQLGSDVQVQALQLVSETVIHGEFLCLLGPSGCGKSTLLRLIAGIEHTGAGQILCGGIPVTGPDPSRGFVFQDYGLFPWRTVRQNIQFGLELKKVPRRERKEISDYYLNLMELSHAESLYPEQISGGMKQRVAIARSLCLQPDVLLMDEPFGALDALTRLKMQEELMRIWQLEKITVIFVTHDVEEALYLADRIVIMAARPGRVKEVVSVPIARPRSRTSQDFLHIRAQIYGFMGLDADHTKAAI
ncbi:ABC transporter ATP-binding protein [Paenibacillus sp. sptzw28]|uniref:ABC transporter ATP-binding protein n=1 Tax=Paenibacillus sp. sptzw28 TaxID=715179 RepID=UPI001C6E937A|nr:ABC transporter ATP-binding protein [Paenibacillus sp. sptzw28]QYR21457.1 ABC transporter ATP-binding protein [Paenibacillus sp. sptzw28]